MANCLIKLSVYLFKAISIKQKSDVAVNYNYLLHGRKGVPEFSELNHLSFADEDRLNRH